jgi:malate dehydrogenase (oxaloacetate-decarboxylating)
MSGRTKKLLEKAEKPGKLALKYHPYYRGKIEIIPKCVVRSFDDFGIWYTPGVAKACKEIEKNKELVYDYTNKWNTVAIVSDCTRVLGLGDIGPYAGMPVMEGKALLFKYLGGIDAFPICLDTKKPDEIINVVKWLQPSFGGINLEDIEKPKCFYILENLRKELEIPVWHDDQQGTATIALSGLINALKIIGKKINQVSIAMIGAGAANIKTAEIIIAAGVKPKNILMVDSKGILNTSRSDIEKEKDQNPYKWKMCLETNGEGRIGGIQEAMKNADVCIAMSTPGPDIIKKEWVSKMANNSIIFACANPTPEIWPWDAKEAGARIIATGRSDFPNQINNSLGFPGIFRGTLDVRAKTITDEMCIAAAYELAKCAEEKGIHENYITPTMEEWEVFPREAVAVGMKAIEQGIARKKMSKSELYDTASSIIKRSREITKNMMKKGYIKQPPK